MEVKHELVMRAIYEKDTKYLSYCLTRGININKICSNGMTLLGAAAQSGNLSVLQMLFNCRNNFSSVELDYKNENRLSKPPQFLQLDSERHNKSYKNIGYFVVCRDVEENEFGDGPTPDGMEALEWDMEITETPFTPMEDEEEGEVNMYKWYASILNRTSVMLDSPERDLGRLDRHGQSVLHYAVSSRNIAMVEYLMETLGKDLSVNQSDACGYSPLHLAAMNGDTDMVQWLVQKGAHIEAVGGRQRQTPLQVAACGGHFDAMRLLVEAGANVNAVDCEERSPLTAAVRTTSEEAVRFLIKAGARINHEEAGGVTALRLAVWANSTDIARQLLLSGARLIHSHHLLHTAISNHNLELVGVLVQAGAALNVRDEQGHTPLMLACSRKNVSIARYLLSSGADANAASHIDGKTALHICVQDVREKKSIQQLVELLVRHGADMNATSYQGNILFYSIILENRLAAAELVKHGADVNLRDDRAYVDNLSLAKRHGDLDLVKLLVFGGFHLAEMIWEPRALRTQPQDPACDFLISVKTNPLQLRELCRILIRRRIGCRCLLDKIKQLPLPTLLQKYLSLDIF